MLFQFISNICGRDKKKNESSSKAELFNTDTHKRTVVGIEREKKRVQKKWDNCDACGELLGKAQAHREVKAKLKALKLSLVF